MLFGGIKNKKNLGFQNMDNRGRDLEEDGD